MKVEANKDYSGVNHKNFLIRSEMYFEALNEKDLDKLEDLYHKNVELYDWNGSWVDSPTVLQFNKTLFDACFTFELIECKQIENRTYNHILIYPVQTDNFFQNPPMKVLDILHFDDDFKITKIEAFKG
jgi:hypothetical protein